MPGDVYLCFSMSFSVCLCFSVSVSLCVCLSVSLSSQVRPSGAFHIDLIRFAHMFKCVFSFLLLQWLG